MCTFVVPCAFQSKRCPGAYDQPCCTQKYEMGHVIDEDARARNLAYFLNKSTMAYSCDPNKRVALNKRVAWPNDQFFICCETYRLS